MEFKKSLKAIKQQILEKEKDNFHYKDNQQDKPSKQGCLCTDSNDNLKTLYTTKKEAAQEVELSKEKLFLYACPYSNGWHLTKG